MLATRTGRGLAVASLALAASRGGMCSRRTAAPAAPPARAAVRATTVACGATITTSTTLANDLSCTGNGLEVARRRRRAEPQRPHDRRRRVQGRDR